VLNDVDIITIMVDVAGGIGPGDYFVLENIKDREKPKVLLLNKIDLVSKSRVKEEKKKLENLNLFHSIIPISAMTGENVEIFLNEVASLLPEGPQYFPEDMVTDQPLRKIVSEIVREKLFRHISEEVPHCLDVEVEDYEETRTNNGEPLVKVECNILTEKDSQKAIVIGKEGNMLKRVGTEARIELENILGCKVFLKLWVKVKENWTKKESYLAELGY
ncbi:MAG: GTPase Era, partial [Actinobacteria bacterium]|nr:GTPase Era [Actinomycetota bacterium]